MVYAPVIHVRDIQAPPNRTSSKFPPAWYHRWEGGGSKTLTGEGIYVFFSPLMSFPPPLWFSESRNFANIATLITSKIPQPATARSTYTRENLLAFVVGHVLTGDLAHSANAHTGTLVGQCGKIADPQIGGI